jgi:hypothetical protein
LPNDLRFSRSAGYARLIPGMHKQDIFQSVLDLHAKKFNTMRENAFRQFQNSKEPLRKQLYDFLFTLIDIHEPSKELHLEMKQLSFHDAFMKSQLESIDRKVQEAIKGWLLPYKQQILITDPEAASLILMDFANALIDRIVFEKLPIPRDRLIMAGVNALVAVVGLQDDKRVRPHGPKSAAGAGNRPVR